MYTVVVADMAGWHPTQKCCVPPFSAEPRIGTGEIHFAILMCILVTQFCAVLNRITTQISFLPLIFFFSETGVKKEVQKDQDASRPTVSSPKKSAATATKLHSPGIYEPGSIVSGKT